ncbi:hypothetical protein [Umezawaea sp. NPDC059074]|uniref:hypothetical protein n=1 Tax=Umezawaea sp. NPDC059074 TaxID=3346716 RepID=UPI0036C51A93
MAQGKAVKGETFEAWTDDAGVWHATVRLPEGGYTPEKLAEELTRLRDRSRRVIRKEIGKRGGTGMGHRSRLAVADMFHAPGGRATTLTFGEQQS